MRRIWGPLTSHRSSKASTTNAIVCVSWNERLFLGRSKCRPSRDGRPTTCLRGLKCCFLPSRSSLLGDYRGLDVASIDPFESTTITRNFEESCSKPRYDKRPLYISVENLWNVERERGMEGEGSNSTTRRTRSLIDIVYRLDRWWAPGGNARESVAKFVKGFDRFHLSRDATRQRRRAR